jgi:hypothetical protein
MRYFGAPYHRHAPVARHGHPGQAHRSSLTLAERRRRTVDRIDPTRVSGPRHCRGRGAPTPDSAIICVLLQRRQNASVIGQGCSGLSTGAADRKHQIALYPRRTSSPLCPRLGFRYVLHLHKHLPSASYRGQELVNDFLTRLSGTRLGFDHC